MGVLHRVPPGRAGVLWLRHRLQVAERGSGVLRQKLTMLVGERDRLLRHRADTARAWAAADRRARTWLGRAAVLDGAAAIDTVDTPPVSVRTRWTTVMGVRYPEPPLVEIPLRPAGHPPAGGAAFAQAEAAYRAAAQAAARFAAADTAVRTIETEITTTRQRVRALDRHWIPRLRTALSTIELQMAELEAADTVRRLRRH